MIRATDYVIDESNYNDRLVSYLPERGRGLVPRDMEAYPVGSYEGSVPYSAIKDKLPLIPWADMPELIRERVANKTQLSDMRNTFLDGKPMPYHPQGNSNFCWSYAAVHALEGQRMKNNLPYVPLSPHGVGCKIFNYSNRGGWSAKATAFIMREGAPPETHWPQQSWSRSHDNERTWQEAKKYRFTEGWIDYDAPDYDRDMTFQAVLSCLIWLNPIPADFNHMSHAVCLYDAVDAFPSLPATDPNRYGVRFLNSWKGWGDNGMGVLTKRLARPDNAVCPRAPVLSA